MLEAPNRRQARFITFEGGEGVGKSTQVKRLLANLASHSVDAVRTREPAARPRPKRSAPSFSRAAAKPGAPAPKPCFSPPPATIMSTN